MSLSGRSRRNRDTGRLRRGSLDGMAVTMFNVVDQTSGEKVGVVVALHAHTSLRTLVLIADDQGLRTVSSRIEFARQNPFSWTHQFLVINGQLRDIGREGKGPRTLPAHAALLVARHLAEHPEKKAIECELLDELSQEPLPVVFSHQGGEIVLSSQDRELARVELADERILAVRWGDHRARVTIDPDDLMSDLGAEARRVVNDFLPVTERN